MNLLNEAPEQEIAEDRIKFCPFCGGKLDKHAKFCKNCGERLPNLISNDENNKNTSQKSQDNMVTESDVNSTDTNKRRNVYEGVVYKCPNCGEILKSFESHCPSCGYEVRNSVTTTSVKEFYSKLESIYSKSMPEIELPDSLLRKIVGYDPRDKEIANKAKNDFEEQKTKEIESLIINYHVPNTKEDILEFMLLAESNINDSGDMDNEITKAWLTKYEQVYKKALISLTNKEDFKQIEDMYTSQNKKVRYFKNKKIMPIAILFGIQIIGVMLLGLLSLFE